MQILSLGAGVQSTTVALMAATGELEKPDCAIFADTGWEPRKVYEHLNWLTHQLPFPVYTVQQGNIRQDIADAADHKRRLAQPPVFLRHEDGKKGQIRRACTYEYKVRPIQRLTRELLGMRPRQRFDGRIAEKWFGISMDEVHRVRDSEVPFITNRYPLIELEMSRIDCIRWLVDHGFAVPAKSACIGCPYHSDRYWRHLRNFSPEEWADAVAVDKLIRHGIPGVRLPGYLHASLVPLDEVDLRSRAEKGQIMLWDEDDLSGECTGHCGV